MQVSLFSHSPHSCVTCATVVLQCWGVNLVAAVGHHPLSDAVPSHSCARAPVVKMAWTHKKQQCACVRMPCSVLCAVSSVILRFWINCVCYIEINDNLKDNFEWWVLRMWEVMTAICLMVQSKRNSELGCEVLTAIGTRIKVFWDLTPCNFVDG
jgi:hypothetical protein